MHPPAAPDRHVHAFGFSPDGRWVAFTSAASSFMKVPIEGGRAVTVVDEPAYDGIDWGEHGEILVALLDRHIHRVSEQGGETERLTELSSDEFRHMHPLWIDAESFLFSAVMRDGTERNTPLVTRCTTMRTGRRVSDVVVWMR